jgi:uncharacterized membrane protein YheB (UPF0754 family)
VPSWLYLLLTVPTVSAFIGWLTNWQAVKMIFWPERPVGVGALSWQGIVFHHADVFASNLGKLAGDHLMTGSDMIERLGADAVESLLAPTIESDTAALCEEAAEEIRPGAWAALPEHVRAMIVAQVVQRTKAIAGDVVAQLRTTAAEIMDVQALVKEQLSGPNVRRLARLTQQIGHREFFFIEWSGGLFGFIIGLAQILVWESMQRWWVMPIFGVVVGLITNWLAIQMIFRPHERTLYLGFLPYQGLFPRRQKEIAHDYGTSTGAEVITPATVIDFLTRGERGARLEAAVRDAVARRLDAEWQAVKAMVPVPVSEAQLAAVRERILARLFAQARALRPRIELELGARLDIARTVEGRLASLPAPEFERLLRGVFQKDELTLIVVGGFLGGAVGCIQAALVLAGI